MLYLVGTPIGNLGDVSQRALETLKQCDLILCEDTRVSRNLLNHFDIKIPLQSYHGFNEKQKLNYVISLLHEGKNIALISDAGMPLIQDPGFILVEACQKEELPYTVIPGPSSILCALVLSGFEIKRFQFIGFFEKTTSDLKKQIEDIAKFDGLSVAFESPKRVLDTLKTISQVKSDLKVAIIREITKKFETVHKGSLDELTSYFSENEPRGEIVMVIQGVKEDEKKDFTSFAFMLMNEGLSKKTAYKLASTLGDVNKDLLYKSDST